MGLPIILFGYQETLRTQATGVLVEDITAHTPENSGFTTGNDLSGMQEMAPTMPKGPVNFTDAGMTLAASDQPLQNLDQPMVELRQCC